MKKSAFVIIATITLLFSAIFSLNVMAFDGQTTATEYDKYYGSLTYRKTADDEIVITGCSKSATSVKIPSVIENCPVTTIGYRAFKECSALTAIEIPNSVSVIEGGAFRYCTGIKSIVIPEGVEELSEGLFYNCTSLESVSIPSSVKTIREGAFYGNKITELVISDNVKTISDRAVVDCAKLERVTIPCHFDTTRVFENCTKLSTITITHTWEEWTVKTEATDTQPGLKEAGCMYCLEVQQETIPAKNGQAEPVEPGNNNGTQDPAGDDKNNGTSDTKKSTDSKKQSSDDDEYTSGGESNTPIIITAIIVGGITVVACVTIVAYFATKKK